jgi:hypothetical protein
VSSPNPTGTALTFSTNGNANGVAGISWSGDGAYIAIAAGSLSAGGSASIYAYPARAQYGKVVPTYYPVSVAFSPNGSALVIGEVTCGKVMLCADSRQRCAGAFVIAARWKRVRPPRPWLRRSLPRTFSIDGDDELEGAGVPFDMQQ